MNDKIKNHVEALFSEAPRSRRAGELKDELISNLNERYNDLIAQGQDEDTAYKVAVAGIGDMDELLRSLREHEIFDPVQIQVRRQKSALFVSVAIALYIISVIFPIIFGVGLVEGASLAEETGAVIGVALMFICCAVATMLLVYNALSKPKYVKMDNTIVEDFKEWKTGRDKKSAMLKSISSIIWLVALIVFFFFGFFLNAWSPGWLVFLLAPVINHIIKLVAIYREDD